MVGVEQAAALLEADAALSSGGTTTPPPPPLLSSSSGGPASLGGTFVRDAHIVALTTHDFFAEVLPGLLLVFLVFAGFAVLTWIWTTVWAFLLRRCGLPEHWVRLTTYLWAIVMVLFGLAAAFGAVGINFGHLFIGFGLLSIAFSAGVGSTIANLFSGIMLQTHGLYANHERVRLPSYNGLTGSIVSMNLLHVVVRPDATSPAGPGAFAPQSVLVPNTVFTDTPVEVEWSQQRQPAYPNKPARASFGSSSGGGSGGAMTTAQRRAYGAAKRQADLDIEAGDGAGPAGPAISGRFAGRTGGGGEASSGSNGNGMVGGSLGLGQLAKLKLEEQRHRRRVVAGSRAGGGSGGGGTEPISMAGQSSWSFDK
jgi:hypothetical protein